MQVRSRTEPNRFARELFDGLPTRYDALAELLSFGQNGRWRAAMVDRIADGSGEMGAVGSDDTVLDVATGTAGVALMLEERTGARVVGLDLTEAMLRQGRQNVARRGRAERIALLLGQGERLPFPDASFAGLTFTYLLRYVADPAAALAELARVVRPGGVVASLEFHVPPPPLWRPLWWLYTRVVLPLGGAALGGREWFEVGRFLGPSISQHYGRYSDDWTADAWRRAGLVDVGLRTMSLGGGVVMWGRKAGRAGG
ncbi:MAG TPA: class I SAM-dependent methyltransferase [Acidimicrobiales bacterium]|nr:class I SAM-dependent methyltransferase [Acidimicrobiales bacterium]